jgi:hypothetical protein
MTDRQSIVEKVKKAKKFPFYIKVDDIDRDHRKISAMLLRRGLNDHIGISKEPEKGLLWFFKRRG